MSDQPMSDQTGAEADDGKTAFELASPEALLVSTAADMVVVPGAEGDLARVLDATEAEIACWRAHREEFGYLLTVARPV
ncbi:hypothetical protein LCGC14_2990240 [marine sediment metagenome]|uniref:Uncharacterized protein n=1 Tax=marine sediment metagenome TaxID=412755 RepID=A0A0F8ZBJ7_9ZZZZ